MELLFEEEKQTQTETIKRGDENSISCFVILSDSAAFNLKTKSYNLMEHS